MAQVADAPLAEHTAVAAKAMLHELRRHGLGRAHRRRRGPPAQTAVWSSTCGSTPSVSRTQAERLATHVAQRVRVHDPWARALDATVHL